MSPISRRAMRRSGAIEMEIFVISIFPDFAGTVFEYGIVRRAVEAGTVSCKTVDLRNFADGVHRQVDDSPFGGGPGMVFMPEPVFKAVESLEKDGEKPFVVYTSPAGEPLSQELIDELASKKRLAILCGRYEGVDQRVIDVLVDREVSLGDFILSGGEIAAMAIVDAVVRRIPGALGNEESHRSESFADGLLDCPHYTRPEEFRGVGVPKVLLEGDPEAVENFRRFEAMRLTCLKRPDLWAEYCRRYRLRADGGE